MFATIPESGIPFHHPLAGHAALALIVTLDIIVDAVEKKTECPKHVVARTFRETICALHTRSNDIKARAIDANEFGAAH
ncbi:hypothetical protein [Pararobbsia silviterrae]|uniref:Uncharacterized protein n=1 Tax=Pararobbsia silviterrae TaxID=1792498 RepID=A0A494YB12_9BURK|nr:hypothetical protein [Pararobbsia silviterrae]RKP57835.1 hypothetical protein D7S86_07900 [Pararobbsia silviterrae]